MKTTMIARCVFASAAIFAAAGLIGCGAESGQGETGAIGSTSEALSRSAVTPTGTAPTGLVFASSCIVHDTFHYDGVDHDRYLTVRAGGFNNTAASTPVNTYELVDDGGNVVESGAFGAAGDAVAHAQMIQVPGSSTKCLLAGGMLSTTTYSAKSWLFEMKAAANAYTGGFTQSATLNSARAKFAVAPCAASKIIAFGGIGTSSAKPVDIEVWGASLTSANNWTDYNSASAPQTRLGTGRFDLAAIGDPDVSGTAGSFTVALSSQNFAVIGGNSGSGATKLIDLVSTDNTCAVTGVTSLTPHVGSPLRSLSVIRDRLVAFPEGTTDHKVIVVGADNANVTTSLETITLDFATPNNTDSVASTPASNFTNARRPTLVKDLVNNRYVLIGGENGNSNTADLAGNSTALVMEYDPNNATPWRPTVSLGASKVGLVAELNPSSLKIHPFTGANTLAGRMPAVVILTNPSTVDEITTP